MSVGARPSASAAVGLVYRPAHPSEIAVCAEIWRVSINHYIVPLGQHEIPPDTNQVIRLFAHLRTTDPERFVVAISSERVVAFAAAVKREQLWYLSMLFVLPEIQGVGVGRELLARVLPEDDGVARATATDSAQPIANALYATYGMVPRMPLLSLIGLPERPGAFGQLPSGVVPVAFEEAVTGSGGGQRRADLEGAIEELDRELVGVARPQDHGYLRSEGRRGWLYRGPDGQPLGYGYAGESGRLGPVAVRDQDLLGPVLGHLTSAVLPRGAFAVWIGGAADRALVPLLRAGFRLESFPVLLCWDRPFADFARFIPNSPGLL